MAEVAFQNYDPEFGSVARAGDILVGGFSFGCGSSREQAATCLAHFGIPLVVAGSFSATYKRNAFNNGFPLLDCPDLLAALREATRGGGGATVRTGLESVVDFAAGEIRVGDSAYSFAPLGPTAQKLVIAGGLEALVRAGG
jgi:homoaconitate hydratase